MKHSDEIWSEEDSLDWQQGGFGIYLHWPFCSSKCPYCDFNSHVQASVDTDRWRRAYSAQLKRYASEFGERILQTVYFGGGTPSLMEPELVADILETIRAHWRTANDLEITLEANPGSVEAARFKAFRQAGVNRVSIGVQALDDAALKALGRLHSKREALTALEIANETFDRVNFDLIYARQNQSLTDWKSELTNALSLARDHLSLYQLTVEEGTAFFMRAKEGKLPGLPEEALAADMYDLTQDLTGAAGFPAYEISNHARKGSESRHNLIYWRGGDYIGIGPGAHGRVTTPTGRWATEASRLPGKWLEGVEGSPEGESIRHALDREDRAIEYLLMSLRTNEGMNLPRYERMLGKSLPSEKVRELTEMGLVRIDRDYLRTTKTGRPVLNAILRELAP